MFLAIFFAQFEHFAEALAVNRTSLKRYRLKGVGGGSPLYIKLYWGWVKN